MVEIVSVKYSREELLTLTKKVGSLEDGLDGSGISSIGPRPDLNKVEVTVSRRDKEILDSLRAALPRDALKISVQPVSFELIDLPERKKISPGVSLMTLGMAFMALLMAVIF